jgi:hypothetical protein
MVENGETDFGVWVILVKSPISALAESRILEILPAKNKSWQLFQKLTYFVCGL